MSCLQSIAAFQVYSENIALARLNSKSVSGGIGGEETKNLISLTAESDRDKLYVILDAVL